MEATKRPWTVHGTQITREGDGFEYEIASASNSAVPTAEALINARLIVTAVNLHEEMLEALKRALPWLGKMIADGNHLECVRPFDVEKTLALMESVLAKVKEG